MTLEYEFSGIRIQDQVLTPVDWKLTVDLVATVKKGNTREEAEYAGSIIYQKVYFWLEANLPNVVVLDVNNTDDLYIANLSSNMMMYCPGNPSDDMIAQLLHSKITALARSELIIGEVHLHGSDTSLKYTFDCNEGEYNLPEFAVDYYNEGILRDELPWWSRDDGFCFEFSRPDTEDASDLFKEIVDPMDEFHKAVSEAADIHIETFKEPAKILQVDKWKPKTV